MTDNVSKILSDLFAQSEPITYKKGDIIHRPEDRHKGAYYVEMGNIKVFSISKTGSEHIHTIYKQGDLFPLRWIFLDIHGKAFYQALSPVIMRRLPKEKFLEEINAHPALIQELIKRILDVFDVYVTRVDNLQHTTAHRRLIAMLLFLAKRFGIQEGEKIKLEIILTHQEMANLINTARETVSRELRKLIEKGIITQVDQHIVIKNIVELKKAFHL